MNVSINALASFDLPCSPASGEVICVIGDIHGRSDLLAPLIDEAECRLAERQSRLVMLGDLVDRGPDSLGCIDLAIDVAERMTVTALMGNHEQMLRLCLSYLRIPQGGRHDDWAIWLRNGGQAVMDELTSQAGFAIRTIAEMRQALGPARMRWFDGLRVHYSDGPLLFVHAGVPWAERAPDRLARFLSIDLDQPLKWIDEASHPLWTTQKYLRPRSVVDAPLQDELFIVHGHMPLPQDVPHIEHLPWGRLNLDGGSWSSGRALMGVIDGASVDIVEAIGPPLVTRQAAVAPIKRRRAR
jgi:serine/threonine protein phosphatase 1